MQVSSIHTERFNHVALLTLHGTSQQTKSEVRKIVGSDSRRAHHRAVLLDGQRRHPVPEALLSADQDMPASGTTPSGPERPEKALQFRRRISKDASVSKCSTRIGTAALVFTAIKQEWLGGYGPGNPGLVMQPRLSMAQSPLAIVHIAPWKSKPTMSCRSWLHDGQSKPRRAGLKSWEGPSLYLQKKTLHLLEHHSSLR